MLVVTHVCRVALFVALASLPLRAQQARGSVTMTGQVSAVAAVAAKSTARVLKGDAQVSAEAAGAHEVILSLSGPRGGETQIEIPIQLRSNVAFALTASWTARGGTLSALSVVEIHAAGAFVHPGAAKLVEVPPTFDGRPGAHARQRTGPELSSPAIVLTGPPISMSGTLNSPGNMLEVVLRVVLKAHDPESGWNAELKVSAARRGN